ncbi:MAG TPA: archease [Baekduia sp.]|nr:archease [Baekduia sp.]
MTYGWVDHTAELELHINAPTEEAVFEDALRALAELVHDGARRERATFEVELSARDRAMLLAEWLDELVFRAETEGLVPEAVERLRLDDGRLTATVRAHHGEPRHLVKGVTYHRLDFERAGDECHACVVLDV